MASGLRAVRAPSEPGQPPQRLRAPASEQTAEVAGALPIVVRRHHREQRQETRPLATTEGA